MGLVVYDVNGAMQNLADIRPAIQLKPWGQFQILAGMLPIIQGFETSRYLGDAYDRETRVRTMRMAQWISGLVYVLFIALALPLIPELPDKVEETAIIHLSANVASILPPMLIFAVVMSQFSASVADTVGGLINGITNKRLTSRWAYVAIAVGALALNWTTEIFDVVAYASRVFAFYYLLQCAAAFIVAHAIWQRLAFAGLAGFLALVVVFATPAT